MIGLARTSRHSLTLPADHTHDALTLEITWAPPPANDTAGLQPIVFYVLDPFPILFGAAALHAYSTSGYFSSAPATNPETSFRRMHVVGIGHSLSDFEADAQGWNNVALRQLRRRDFPPFDHPSIRPGRAQNENAARLAKALTTDVVHYVEQQLLGLQATPRRVMLGASYSAVMALQGALHHPDVLDDLVLGSPSIPFDPQFMQTLGMLQLPTDAAGQKKNMGAFIAVGAEEREPEPEPGDTRLCSRAANVHRGIPDSAHELAALLRSLGVQVDGAHEIEGEDHTSLKLSLVSRGMKWAARRAMEAA